MRDAMCADDHPSAGLYVGARNGAVWASADTGESWRQVVANLPDVMVVRAAALPALAPAHSRSMNPRMGTPFEVTRSTTIQADPARVHGLINDFHEWTAWSPWEDLDPDLQRTYSDPSSGVGAHYAWKGNRKAGEGSMEITGSAADRIDIELAFLKPFRNTQQVEFVLTPAGGGTDVTWRMAGRARGHDAACSAR